jgi:transposase-like protein
MVEFLLVGYVIILVYLIFQLTTYYFVFKKKGIKEDRYHCPKCGSKYSRSCTPKIEKVGNSLNFKILGCSRCF